MKKLLRLSTALMLALGILLIPTTAFCGTNPDFTVEQKGEVFDIWFTVYEEGISVEPGKNVTLRGVENVWDDEVVKNVNWTSSNTDVAEITSVGQESVVIKVKTLGESLITATDPDGNTCEFPLYGDLLDYPGDGVLWYETSERTKTASVIDVSTDKAWNGVFPEAISYKGNVYTVTEIDFSADEEHVKKVKSIEIPSTVTKIKSDWLPFGYVKGLTSIHVAEGNPNYYSVDGVLFEYYTDETGTYKRLHTYPYDRAAQCYQIPEGTQLINEEAFADAKSVKELVIPKSLDLTKYGFKGLYERDDEYNVVKWNIKLWINSENKDAIDYAKTGFDIPIPWEKWEDELNGMVAVSDLKAQLSGKYNTVQVKWTGSEVSSASMKYIVEMKTGNGKWKVILPEFSKTSMKKAKLKAGTKYTFRVTPYVIKDGKTYYGATKTATPVYIMKTLNKPVVKKASKGKIKVSWTNINGETGYQISKSTKKNKIGNVVTVKGSNAKSKLIKVAKGKKYYYKVRAYKTVNGKKIYGPWSAAKAYTLL